MGNKEMYYGKPFTQIVILIKLDILEMNIAAVMMLSVMLHVLK